MDTRRQLLYLAALLDEVGAMSPSPETAGNSFFQEHLRAINILAPYATEIINFRSDQVVKRAVSLVREPNPSGLSMKELKSIFPALTLEGQQVSATDQGYFAPEPLKLSRSEAASGLFPAHTQVQNLTVAFEENWGNFCEAHQLLKDSASITGYARSLFDLLAKYTSRSVPLSGYSTGDVSLFDHSRLVAATANCLSLEGQSLDDPEFVLLIGDLSGLQKFIYSQIDPSEAGDGKGLAKRLRGRSYYIALLTDVIAERLAGAFDVNEANILYAGGGGFQLLLPKVPDYKERIENFSKETNQFLFEKIGGRIGLITGYTETDQTIFQQSSRFIQQAYDHIGEEKARKFEANLDYLFFERPQQGESRFKDDEKLGEKIPYGKLILEIEASSLRLQQGELLQPQASLEALNRYFFILDERKARSDIEADAKRIIEAYRDQAGSFRLLSINDTDFLSGPTAMMQQLPEVDIRAGFRFIGSYAPTRTARGNDEVITFEQLAKKNDVDEDGAGELSYPKLAVMRLDVDNLGALFAMGLGEQASFARVATLSRELHLFFSGYFNKLAEKYSLYVTYSGGDDAFVVGSWLNVMHAAAELYDKFKLFTCSNPELSFSAGIFMCSEYYPVAKFAKKAEEAENRAKAYRANAKDAVCAFGHVLTWTQYKEMLQFAQTILKYVEQEGESDRNKLSRSLIHRIHQIVKRCIREDGTINPRLLYQQSARLHYLFARQKTVPDGFTHKFLEDATSKGTLSLGEEIAQHVIRVFLDYFRNENGKDGLLGNLTIATSYVTYKTRTLEK